MNALMIGEDPPMPEPEAEASDEGAGPVACRAFHKAQQAGDWPAAFEAFKTLLMAADDDLSADEPKEAAPPPM